MIDADTFLDYLRRSGLVEPAVLDEALAEIDREMEGHSYDRLSYLTQSLVGRYLLTAWQVRQLSKGRYKGFFLRQYKILGHLGTGGMSTVYLAEHTVMQRRVAIKVLPKKRLEKAIYLQRFVREAQAIATLDHPNVIRAYDIDREGDTHYIVMEYFEGENLQHLVERESRLPFEQIVRIVHQAAQALTHAHQIGVVHRDVKPGNLLINQEGKVKMLDLGLALLDERQFEGRISSIQEDTILGTADYLAPEQAIDSHRVDARADIYGLGGVLYFCLTGHPPFPEGSVSKRLLAHQQKEPPSILIDRPDTPADLVALCGKMMAKQPGARQQSAREVARDMEQWLVRHGHAAPGEFAGVGEELEPMPLADPEGLIVGRGKLLRLIQQMEEDARHQDQPPGHDSDFSVLGGEVNVNLLDSGVSSGMHRPGGTSAEKRLFAEIRRNARREHAEEDPILMAINEIEHNRSRARRAIVRENVVGIRSSQSLPVIGEPAPTTHQHMIDDSQPWYRQVPVWFWSLFAASVFTAIFMAGVLATLITVMLRMSVEP